LLSSPSSNVPTPTLFPNLLHLQAGHSFVNMLLLISRRLQLIPDHGLGWRAIRLTMETFVRPIHVYIQCRTYVLDVMHGNRSFAVSSLAFMTAGSLQLASGLGGELCGYDIQGLLSWLSGLVSWLLMFLLSDVSK